MTAEKKKERKDFDLEVREGRPGASQKNKEKLQSDSLVPRLDETGSAIGTPHLA